MTAVELLNLALLKIGVSAGISSITDESREAWTGALVFDHNLRASLRAFPWPFATKYAALTLVQGPSWTGATVQAWDSAQTYAIGDVVTSGGTIYYATAAHSNQIPPNTSYWSVTATEEANGDWGYAYRWPSDCLFVRRMVPDGGRRAYSETPTEFRIGRDSTGLLIYTNVESAVIEYTVIDCDSLWADDLFIEALTWRLAWKLAPSLGRDNKLTESCFQQYLLAIDEARTVASRESQQPAQGEASWISAR